MNVIKKKMEIELNGYHECVLHFLYFLIHSIDICIQILYKYKTFIVRIIV